MRKTIKLFCVFISFIFISETYAQKKTDTLTAFKYYKTGDSLFSKNAFTKSTTIFNKALILYKNAEAYKRIADCYDKIGNNYEKITDNSNALLYYEKSYNLKKEKFPTDYASISISLIEIGDINFYTSDYKKAIKFYEDALKTSLKVFNASHENIGKIYNSIGVAYQCIGDLHKSLNYLKKSLEINLSSLDKNHNNISYNYANIGLNYAKLMQDDKALEYYRKALPIFLKNNHKRGILGMYNNMGNILKTQGKWNKALNYYEKSLALTLEYNKHDISTLAVIYMNIGSVNGLLGNFDQGMFFLNKSLENYKLHLENNLQDIAYVYDNIGSLYMSHNDYNAALQFHKKSLTIYQQLGNKIEAAYSLQLLGKLKLKMKLYDDALKHHKNALKITQKRYGTKHLLTSDFYYDVGDANYEKGEYKDALKYLDSSLVSNSINNIENKKLAFNPTNYFNHQLLLKTIHKKALTLHLQYLKTKDSTYLNKSIKLYYKADIIIDYIREAINNHQDKLVLAKQTKAIYSDAIEMHWLKYKNIGETEALKEAWYFTEKSKSNTLKDLLNDTNAKTFSGLPEQLLNLEKTLKSDRAYYQSLIIEEQSEKPIDKEVVQNYKNELFTTNQKADNLIKLLKTDYPKYHKLKHNTNLFSVADIQKKIDYNTTVIEFFINKDKIYTFIISKNDFSIKELIVKDLDKKTEQFRNSIISENIQAYKKTASILYQELITPLKDNLVGDALVIIPDGSLWHLNFDLLLTNKSSTLNNRHLPYLIKDYAISYSNSADLLFNPIENTNKNTNTLKGCLAFSYSNPSNNSSNPIDIKDDLLGAKKEIKFVSKITNGAYFQGKDATETNFKRNVEKYNILHLALHGEVDNDNPQNSKLYFTKTKDTIEDNILYNHELFALNIPAELVVLSACNTGTGKVAYGEGLMSLGNAFQYAGTKSLVLSSWDVPDKTTPELMKYFYLNLKKGMNKSKALQQAKLKYLNNTEAFCTNPFYWGSFYIIGNTDAIDFKNNSNTLYYWIIGVLLFLSLVYLFQKYKSKN